MARPKTFRPPAIDGRRLTLWFGTIAALRAKLSPMPVLGRASVAKFGPIAAAHLRRAIGEYFEKPWILSGV
jgi:xanthine/uracil permease